MARSLPEHLATQEATGHGEIRDKCTYFSYCRATRKSRTRRVPVTAQRGHGGVPAVRFLKKHKNKKPFLRRSRQVFTGCFVITKTKRTQYYRAIERILGTPHRHHGGRLPAVPPDAGMADRRVDCDSAVPHRDVRDPQLHHHRQLHPPNALLMVQTVEASPIWPMLLARTAETVINAFASLAVIAVGYAHKYLEVVLPRR